MLNMLLCDCWPFVYFWKNVYSSLLPIFKLGCLFFWYWIVLVHYIFWTLTLCWTYHPLLFSRWSFCFVDSFLSYTKDFFFPLYSHLFIFVFHAWGDISSKILLKLVSKSIFSSKHFRSYIEVFNLFLIFFHIWCKWSSLILLCVAVQFSQYHLLKRLSFPHCCWLIAHISVSHFCTFHSVPLIRVSDFVPEVYYLDDYSFVSNHGYLLFFFLKILLVNGCLFCFQTNFRILVLVLWRILCFDRYFIESVDCFV